MIDDNSSFGPYYYDNPGSGNTSFNISEPIPFYIDQEKSVFKVGGIVREKYESYIVLKTYNTWWFKILRFFKMTKTKVGTIKVQKIR